MMTLAEVEFQLHALKPAEKARVLEESRQQQAEFANRYGMDFAAFKRTWEDGRIPNKHAYEVERDYWEWEAAVTDEARLMTMLDSRP